MRARVATVDVRLPHDALPDADWADAYAVTVPRRFSDAREATEAAFASFSAWVNGLMALRNLIVWPLGLKTGAGRSAATRRIGFFPLISETSREVVIGLNDRHLDFRCVVALRDRDDGRQDVTITTVIARHNAIGQRYLATILPFHRLIIRSTLRRLARGAAR